LNQAADPVDVSDLVEVLAQHATDKNVTRKHGFDDAHHAAAGRPFEAKTRVKDFQAKLPGQIRRRHVLVFRLSPRAIPNWAKGSHFQRSLLFLPGDLLI
jgi:hypothetical protein